MQVNVAPVMSRTEVLPDVHLVWLEAPEIARAARPGQFLMVGCGGDTLLRRPLSIHRVDGDRLALLFNVVGRGTYRLSECQAGDSLDIFGPLGNGFTINPSSKHLLLVAGGIGVAPLRFLADEVHKLGKKVTILYGASSSVSLLPDAPSQKGVLGTFLPWYAEISKCTDDGSKGYKGLVTELIIDYLDKGDQIFACGPLPMYRTMARMPELKDKPVQVSLEVRMGCGAGICYGCTVSTRGGPRQVCTDGPIFELDDIIWDEPTGL